MAAVLPLPARSSRSCASRPVYPAKLLLPGEDAFDSLEWDPELPPVSSSADKSPEPVTIKPQAVTYTTVGSLVNPNTIQQLSAPNRIQREGANRRPLMTILQGRQFDSVFQSQASPPPLNMSSSMLYAQQICKSPAQNDKILSPAPKSEESVKSDLYNLLTGAEQEILSVRFDGKAPSIAEKSRHNKNSAQYKSECHRYQLSAGMDMSVEDVNESATPLQAPVQGLEKMQTLQRLSKFSNPMQEWARSKLAEFAVIHQPEPPLTPVKGITSVTEISASGISSHYAVPFDKKINPVNPSAADAIEEPGYKSSSWPPSSDELARGRRRVTGLSTSQASANLNRPTGYPLPLTAGPPGQRQYNMNWGRANYGYRDSQPTLYRSNTCDPKSNGILVSHYTHQINPEPNRQSPEVKFPHGMLSPWAGSTSTKLFDSLKPSDTIQYYPSSLPTSPMDMNGGIIENLTEYQDKTVSADRRRLERSIERQANVLIWFSFGQRRFATMTATDFLEESYERMNKNDGSVSIGPPKNSIPAVTDMKASTADVERMSPDLVRVFDNLLGTMLEHADRRTPGSSGMLSKYVDTPTYIDGNEDANKSLFSKT